VALVVRAKRELLLRAHRHRLRREDLEDCYSQAALELVAHACKGGAFWSRVHVGNVLEQRFLSRINDRRRALSGRSPMQAALEGAVSIGAAGESEIEVADVRAELEALVMLRHDLTRLERLARENLTGDQRLVLASQVGLPLLSTRDFCRRFGWSQEKYRKVAQRARRRLRALMAADELAAGQAAPPAGRTLPTGRRLPTERRPSKRPGRE
jgi:DNA-directed RNA polymerase specialized sigma24 family protein